MLFSCFHCELYVAQIVSPNLFFTDTFLRFPSFEIVMTNTCQPFEISDFVKKISSPQLGN